MSLAFSNVAIGVTSSPRTVTVSNPGTVQLQLKRIQLGGGDFALGTGSCGTSLAPGGSCTQDVVFRPTKAGPQTGTLRVQSNAKQGTDTVNLSGTGTATAIPALQLSPASVDFGGVVVGEQSGASVITLTNTGTGVLTLTQIAVSGPFAAGASTCGTSLAPGGSCTQQVSFAPGAPGTASGALTVTDDAAGSPHSATLSGTGLAPAAFALAPDAHDFGAVVAGESSAPQAFTVTNTGDVASGTLAASVSGSEFRVVGDDCSGSTLPAHAACTVGVVFSPTSTGAASDSLRVSGTPGGTATAGLAGTGIPAIVHFSGVARNGTGVPIPGLYVQLGADMAPTDGAGHFSVAVRPGSYELRLQGGGQFSADTIPFLNDFHGPTVTVTGDTIQDLTLPTIRLQIVARDAAGNPLPGTTIRYPNEISTPFELYPGSGSATANTSSGENGHAASTTGPDGTTTVLALPGTFRDPLDVQFPDGLSQPLDPGTLTGDTTLATAEPPPVHFSGVARNGSGVPIPGLYVQLGANGATSDGAGRFSVAVRPGSYELRLQGGGQFSADTIPSLNDFHGPTVTVTGDTIQDLTVPTISLRILARDAAGNPLPGTTIRYPREIATPFELYPGSGPATVTTYSGENGHAASTTGADGASTVPALPGSFADPLDVQFPDGLGQQIDPGPLTGDTTLTVVE
jgi:hypothetical protein